MDKNVGIIKTGVHEFEIIDNNQNHYFITLDENNKVASGMDEVISKFIITNKLTKISVDYFTLFLNDVASVAHEIKQASIMVYDRVCYLGCVNVR